MVVVEITVAMVQLKQLKGSKQPKIPRLVSCMKTRERKSDVKIRGVFSENKILWFLNTFNCLTLKK